ncbi:LytR/AlgR family response regulator transcription factor [Marinifilum caeruleilacunae]|uniref:Response regulator transcription factor n=1 Tax=Marinifilum caeruleilacunae TaxID=2499076 RepID=A0ABX1X206_9BACT|nr:LytTR family DNA-binding domain-containing protein [Marinifilum caeruleilacunae]NOU62119.1 response regulator transcription factor [Marinifilum caeruleilacunae]
MKVLIIEDEIPAQRLLKEIINQIEPPVELVGCLNSVESAVKWFQTNIHPEIVLLDIQLSDGLSFEIFQQINITSMVIFITAYDEYAIQAFKVNSLDYLLKPIDKEELQIAFDKYEKYDRKFLQEKNNDLDYKKLMNLIQEEKKEFRKRFLIQANESFFHLSVHKIALFYSLQGITFALTFEKREYPINLSLENLMAQLDHNQFFKINRGLIINIEAIIKVHSYFQGKLKIESNPKHFEDIIMGKDKAASFKRWLDN